MRVIDLTQIIESTMPVYPGTEPPTFEPANTYEKDGETKTVIINYTNDKVKVKGQEIPKLSAKTLEGGVK